MEKILMEIGGALTALDVGVKVFDSRVKSKNKLKHKSVV